MSEYNDREPEGEDIAIIGMSGRFPGAPDLDRFWRNLVDGVDAVTRFTPEQLAEAGVDPALIADPRFIAARGVLDDIAAFDADFFGITPRDAALLDPQQRLLLECAWEALETAGHTAADDQPTGVYVGVGFPRYLLSNVLPSGELAEGEERQAAIWNDKDHAATRIAYKLGLTGPALTVQSACSSSLAAVHLACQSLLAGECDTAIAGGATIRLPQIAGHLHREGGVDSPEGRCRAFDARADGMVQGSGGGVVVLRRLEDALADRDPVLAVIRGSALTNDGAAKPGYAAPGVSGQERAVRIAHAVAGIDPADVGYVEAHGTGTPLGDPVEIAALTAAFGPGLPGGSCAVGSVKTNIGHLDAGAGVAGLIKTVLMLRHGVIPASLHFEAPNPALDLEKGPFAIARETRDWERRDGRPRVAGVSSFGIGGTNAHLVVAEAPPAAPAEPDRAPQVLALAAKSPEALRAMADGLADTLADSRTDAALADIAATLQTRRRPFDHRRAVVARDRAEAAELLRVEAAPTAPAEAASLAFLFPGQGVAPGGAGLYRNEPAFREAVDECDAILRRHFGIDVRGTVLAADADPRTDLVQPVLFTVEYAAARLWASLGITPAAMIGHSLGEYVAACLAGVMPLDQALWLVGERGRLMGALPPGAMLAVAAPESELAPLLSSAVAIAAVNAPDRCVASGDPAAIAALESRLEGLGVPTRRLAVDRAFHSPATEPVLERFTELVSQVDLSAPRIPFASNTTGTWITAGEATDPAYWAGHLRGTVRFGDGLDTVTASARTLLEAGPGTTLTGFARRCGATAIATLPDSGEDEPIQFRRAAGRLWETGADMDWAALQGDRIPRHVDLPAHPMQRRRHWLEPVPAAEAPAVPGRAPLAAWARTPYWAPAPPPVPAAGPAGAWLVLAESPDAADALAERLRDHGADVTTGGPDWRGDAAFDHLVYLPAARGAAPDPATATRDALAHFTTVVELARVHAVGERIGHLTIVTGGMQPVTAADIPVLDQSVLAGLAGVLARELPGAVVRLVDMPSHGTPSHGTDAAHLADELRAQDAPPSVAWRRGRRWIPAFADTPLPERAAAPAFAEGGAYAITGGLGAVGLELAEYLVREHRARVALIGRGDFPEPGRWRDAAAEPARIGDDALELLRGRLEADPPAPLGSRVADASRACTSLCVAYVLDYLHGGVDLRDDRHWTFDEIGDRLEVTGEFRRFLRSLLAILEEEGLAETDAAGVRFRVTGPVPPAAVQAERVARDYPEFGPVLDLLAACAAAYPAVLSGKQDAVEVLFPDGRASLLEAATEVIAGHSHQGHYLWAVCRAVAALARGAGPGPVRILEVGAGKGRLTGPLLGALRGQDAAYHATDISKAFVDAAAAEHRGDGRTFSTLDISRDPASQGFEEGGFDLVVGFNVVHAAPSVEAALGHLRSLCAPGGLVLLLETVADERWARMVWGMTREWWSYTDVDRRPGSPLMGVADWLTALADAGFADATAVPGSGTGDSAVIAARRPAEPGTSAGDRAPLAPATVAAARRLHALTEAGAEVLVRTADVTDLDQTRAALDDATARFGALDGVFHLAVEGGGGLAELQTPEDVLREFGPKITGTLVLDEALRGRSVDFLVLFSSLNALIGAPGAAAYSAASAFVDRFAHAADGRRPWRVHAIDWALWKDLGTAVSAARRRRPLGADDDIGMDAAEGLEMLRRILAHRAGPQIAVSPVDLAAMAAHAAAPLPAVPAGRPGSDEAETVVAAVWSRVLGIEPIDPEADFAELGGDSLVAAQIIARLREDHGLELPLRDFFAAPTVAGNARAIRARTGAPADPPTASRTTEPAPAPPAPDPEFERLLAEIEALSDEEVQRQLAESDRTEEGERQ